MSSPFDKKSVYHSALVKESPIVVTITCNEPQASKFKGKQDYISFKCEGEEHFYEVENDECADALTGLKGQTVTLIAEGSRSDARIYVEDAEQPPHREQPERRQDTRRQDDRGSSRREEPPARRQEERPPATAEDRADVELKAFKRAAAYGARCAVLMEIAMRYARKLVIDQLTDGTVMPASEDVRALACTLFIELKGVTDITKLPSHFLDLKKEPARRQEPPPKQEPPPPPPPDDDAEEDDIPF